ncbi:uncharacterized protein [Nicotiana sylvestris]|uniref:uncharacterized protein isoform X2 n=1 Tax=Nicotiana sylvestris TaxID=4096 RepID=UPI00388C973A
MDNLEKEKSILDPPIIRETGSTSGTSKLPLVCLNAVPIKELPDSKKDRDLYSLVIKHMMHGPCGKVNPTNICMKNNNCKFKYPKDFAEQTSKGKNSYPIYRRRRTREAVEVRGEFLDNSWVVPYNPFLLCKYNCYMNVEVCSDIKVVKYIYKYICKGHDKITFHIHGSDTDTNIDEIKEYQSAR